jgi:hypothetical protein
MFEEFWMLYPRKVAKASAKKAWQKLTEEQQLLAAKALDNHCQYWKLKETAIEFIPHPATWINQERWEDELIIEPTKAKLAPLATNEQIEQAYRSECGKDPKLARFNSYYEMKDYVLKQRELRFKVQA